MKYKICMDYTKRNTMELNGEINMHDKASQWGHDEFLVAWQNISKLLRLLIIQQRHTIAKMKRRMDRREKK